MPQLRLLASSLLVSALALPAAAQAPANPLPLTATVTTQPFARSAHLNPSPGAPQPTLTLTAPSTVHLSNDQAAKLLGLPANASVSADQKKNLEKAMAGLNKIEKSGPYAASHSPCATLRVYGFTPKDLKSAHPRPSTETDCTALASAHLKPIELPAAITQPKATTTPTPTPK